jgi:AraC family transcriptional regulator
VSVKYFVFSLSGTKKRQLPGTLGEINIELVVKCKKYDIYKFLIKQYNQYMLKPYELLENVLLEIERRIKENINSNELAKKYNLSDGHLRRLFRFAFKLSLGEYIRSRKLALSLDDLLKKDFNVLDVALEYGFEHETSYNRSFKREFGVTPGEMRKKGQIIEVKPPLFLFDKNRLGDNLFFGPDIVIVPQFHLIGKQYKIGLNDFISNAQVVALKFWENERLQIKNTVNQNVYFGYTKNINMETANVDYMPSIQVKNLNYIPQGYSKDTFETSLCVKFRYIGEQRNYYELNRSVMYSMYDEAIKITSNENINYTLLIEKICFEKVNICQNNGTYCQIEWFTPVKVKNIQKC